HALPSGRAGTYVGEGRGTRTSADAPPTATRVAAGGRPDGRRPADPSCGRGLFPVNTRLIGVVPRAERRGAAPARTGPRGRGRTARRAAGRAPRHGGPMSVR